MLPVRLLPVHRADRVFHHLLTFLRKWAHDGEPRSARGSSGPRSRSPRAVEALVLGRRIAGQAILEEARGLQGAALGGEVTLFSFMGIPLLNWTIPSGLEGIYQFSVDVSMVPPGTYTLSWSSATWLVEETIIIP